MRSKVSSPRRPAMYRAGWVLPHDGAQRAASNSAMYCRSVSSTAASNARGLQRSASSGCSGTDESAGLATTVDSSVVMRTSGSDGEFPDGQCISAEPRSEEHDQTHRADDGRPA